MSTIPERERIKLCERGFLTFTFVRNPYERVLSGKHSDLRRVIFIDFSAALLSPYLCSEHKLYSIQVKQNQILTRQFYNQTESFLVQLIWTSLGDAAWIKRVKHTAKLRVTSTTASPSVNVSSSPTKSRFVDTDKSLQ
jgi:hypothetical protein